MSFPPGVKPIRSPHYQPTRPRHLHSHLPYGWNRNSAQKGIGIFSALWNWMSHKQIGESGTAFCSRMLVVPACASTFHREPVKLPNAARVVSNIKDVPSFDARSNREIRLNSLPHNQCDPAFLWNLEHESLSPLSNMLIYVCLENPWESHLKSQEVATSSLFFAFSQR